MKRRSGILSITLIFILGCSFLAPSAPSPSPIPPSQTPHSPTAIPPTSTLAPPTPSAILGTIALDFVAWLCDARWMNGAQHLAACPPGSADLSGGYAKVIDPAAENLPPGTSILLTVPAWNGNAAFFLSYPAFSVHSGDRFRATLRCQKGAPCNVQYALEYYDANGKYSGPFLSWNFAAGRTALNVDADLSALAGQTVSFVLALRPNNDAPRQDGSLWIGPYIYRSNR